MNNLESIYNQGCALAESADYAGAKPFFSQLIKQQLPPRLQALVHNDLGTFDFLEGEMATARDRFERALTFDQDCRAARQNLEFLDRINKPPATAVVTCAPAPTAAINPAAPSTRVAILSLLFNWPSTGGGTVHTAETGKFLCRAGYEVQHFYTKYAGWGVGNVTLSLDHPATALGFEDADWNAHEIQRRFRDVVDLFAPDYVIITDSWSFKPLLAEAISGYRYFLRLAAQECLCPLNNVRLLVDDQGRFSACPRNQMSTADACRQCVSRNQHQSGSLHQAERALSGYGTAEYDHKLRQAFAGAEGILAVNPLIAAMVGPYAKAVHVVPSGFDPDRFPWPWPDERDGRTRTKTTLFFAGLVNEYMKGFHVLQAACAKLWQTRQDFELVATSDPAGQIDPMTRSVGWLSQDELPKHLRQADIVVCPTIAEEALGRTAVEAMGVGRPVIASRIGGLPFTVTDGLTGLLCEPGNADELAAKIASLLDDAALRVRLGEAGRKRFENEYTWDAIIKRHYKQLLPCASDTSCAARSTSVPQAPCSDRPNSNGTQFIPRLRTTIDESRLVTAAAEFFGLQPADVARTGKTYRDFSERQGYASQFGELKTLSTAEAFLLCLSLSLTRPPVIVELGTQYGKSTRRIVDLADFLGLDSQIISYDIVDELQYVRPEEIDFRLQDLTGQFRTEVLDKFGSGLVFSDAHGFSLLSEVVRETMGNYGNWTLAIHDCGPGLCNPRMPISRDDPNITSTTGLWERHVLAEAFSIDDPLSPVLDSQTTPTRRMRIFETQHGLGLIIPLSHVELSTAAPLNDRAGAIVSV